MRKFWKWEFWPYQVFYIPLYVLYLWYSLRAWSMVFFSAANPCMEMGGFIDYSKLDILKKLNRSIVPKSTLIEPEDAIESVKEQVQNGEFNYPFILKPDKGQRGYGVELIRDETQLQEYLSKYRTDFILQEFIDYPLEFGVMYSRHPAADKGKITSVVQKGFLNVTGDGSSTLESLFEQSKRARYYLPLLKKKYEDRLNEVLEREEVLLVEPIGNHSRGTAFLNANRLINDQLVDTFDRIAKEVDGFYFGRFDLRVATLEDLYEGKIMVMELNGANSEPAHIYETGTSIFEAYKDLFRHWKLLYEISIANHWRGVKYMKLGIAYPKVRGHYKRRKKEVMV